MLRPLRFRQSELVEQAIALNPVDPEAYNNRALTFKDLAKLADAIADCDQAIVLNKNSDFAYATRGLILQLQGNLWEIVDRP